MMAMVHCTQLCVTRQKESVRGQKLFSLYLAKVKIESMEEYSEAKTYNSEPELRNSNVNADYFYSAAEIIIIGSRTWEFVNDKPCINRHASA